MNTIKATKVSKYISISLYLIITLTGQMIGLPFFIWIVFTFFDFGNFDQLFAVLAVTGLIVNIINRHKKKRLNIILLDLFCFALLLSPIIRRMTAVPIEMFDYLAFIIPTTIFVLFYLISIGLSFKTYFKNEQTT